ncbi:MAG: translocation/assembly module TamB domain-containing protein, partial [Casimicrobiaceae bacterium]
AELSWQAGPRVGRIAGLEFGYAGNAQRHALSALQLVSEFGALSGNVTLGARAPLALDGAIALVGAGPLQGARLDTRLGGTLAAISLDGAGQWQDATLKADVRLTPFAANAVEAIAVALDKVDLASLVPTLPRTEIALTLQAQLGADGPVGTFDAVNRLAGPIDRARLPIDGARGSFAASGSKLALSSVELRLAGGGRANGSIDVDLGGSAAPSRVSLTVRNVDLRSLHSQLIETRLAGRLYADIEGSRQRIRGDLADAKLSVAFDATVANKRVDVTSLRARAGGGSIEGSGQMELAGARTFSANLAATHIDPSRFGAFPVGNLDGKLVARGRLQPAWQVTAELALREGSKLSGVAVSGTASGTIAAAALRDVVVDVHAASARAQAKGNAGTVGDKMAFTLSVPKLAELAAWLPANAPKPMAGRLQASGTLRVEPGGAGGDVVLAAERLQIGATYAARTLDIKASLAPGGDAQHALALDARPLTLSIAATDLRSDLRALDSASINGTGSLAQHRVTLAARGEDIDASASLSGAFIDFKRGARHWKGMVAEFENRGVLKLALTAPANFDIAPDRISIDSVHVAVADGRVDIGEFVREQGRITSRGSFTGISLAAASKLVGRPLTLGSSLRFGGQWDLAATPRLNGTFLIARESGDIYGREAPADAPQNLGFGITTLRLDGTIRDDTLDASASMQSARIGNARATLKLATAVDAPRGYLGPDARLDFSLDGDIASLQPLQPWLGTTAVVDGTATLRITGTGTLGAPKFSGTLAADRMRIDAPQLGINLRDGRLRAHLVERSIVVDAMQFTGGDGQFVASGTLGTTTLGDTPDGATQITWRAQKFRLLNRPDRRLVIGGNGTLAIIKRRLVISGAVNVEEGHIEYQRSPPGRLGADVTVKGWPAPEARRADMIDLPLALDLEVDLGQKLTFVGEGLETGLTGHVRVATGTDGSLQGHGTISAVNGTYFAFGQKLTIDRGQLIFDGPLSNPALDIVALRRNLAVEAGVRVTGTVRVPAVTITSNPPVPQNEALAWLITGQGLSGNGNSSFGALSAASAALLSRDGKPLTTQVAQTIGLDDITIQNSGPTTTGGVRNQVVVFGKRITNDLTLGFEQGVSLASGAVRLEYALTRALTIRVEAGPVSGVGLAYRHAFD